MDFQFTNEINSSRIEEAVYFMLGPRLWIPQTDYPDFIDWTDKTYKELKTEAKRAMLCLKMGRVVGVAIYQQHHNVKNTLEIKNLTVRPDLRGRHIASFLLRNTEIEGSHELKCNQIICDAKANNYPVMNFLIHHHYHIKTVAKLYRASNEPDVVFTKDIFPATTPNNQIPTMT